MPMLSNLFGSGRTVKLPVLQTEVSRCSVPLKLIVDWSLENWLHQFELQDENKLILTCPYLTAWGKDQR